MLTIPFLILGSFSMVIMQFPLKAWQELLPGVAGGSVKLLLMAVYQATFGSLSFICIFRLLGFLLLFKTISVILCDSFFIAF